MFIATSAWVSPEDDKKKSNSSKTFSTSWVSFPTQSIDAVHPEWWGAGALPDDPDNPERTAAVDTAAMEAALQSALLRTPWSALVASRGRQLEGTPLAVELRSQVCLSHELRVGGREWELVLGADLRRKVTPSVDGLVIRGHRGATSPHLRGQFFGGERVALLSVHRPEGLRLEDLWLDAGEGFVSDLLVVLYAKGPAALTVTDCRFAGKAQRLAWVLDALDLESVFRPVTTGAPERFTEGVWAGEVTAHDVTFTGCAFTTTGGQVDPPTALQVHAAGVTVSVFDGAFSGSAAAMVSLSAGALRLHRCAFSNSAVAQRWFATSDRPPVPESGVDVRVGPTLLAPVSVELVSCRSTSLQLLAMDVRELLDQARGLKLSASFDDTLGNVCSARVVDCFHGAEPVLLRALALGERLPAPIYWGSDAATTFALTLIGCRLGAARVATSLDGSVRDIPPGKVAVSRPNDQRIYDAWLLPPGPRYEVWNNSQTCNVVTLAPRTVAASPEVREG